MSHGGIGFHSAHYTHHGLHGHFAHHGDLGHHGGDQVLNAALVLGLLQGVFVSIFGEMKSVPTLERWAQALSAKQQAAASANASPGALEASEWESSFQTVSWKQKLLHADLRPYIILAIFLGILFIWLQLIVWLRHHDDSTGQTFTELTTQEMVVGRAAAPTGGSQAGLPAQPALPPGGTVPYPSSGNSYPYAASAAASQYAAQYPASPGVSAQYTAPMVQPNQYATGYYSQTAPEVQRGRLRVVVTH